MKLFDDFERTNSAPAAYQEDSFAFLNRVRSPYWAKVRRELECWFARYPREHALDVHARFRSRDPRQHYAAWWELYLFNLFTQLGYHVQVHPDIEDAATHPDFLMTDDLTSFFVEALTVFSGIVEEGRDGVREAWILDLINEVKNPNFSVGLEFVRVGKERPAAREVKQPLESWLATLDADAMPGPGAGGERPELDVSFRDWELKFEAFSISAEHRGDPRHRLLGLGPMSGGFVNDIEQLGRGLRRKSGHYGTLNKPLVIAVLGVSPTIDREDLEQTLFGRVGVQYNVEQPTVYRWVRQRDGIWVGPGGPTATNVSAVVTAAGLLPTTCAREFPQLWINPWAEKPLRADLPFARATVGDAGTITYREATVAAHEVLELAEEWPGPEPAFE